MPRRSAHGIVPSYHMELVHVMINYGSACYKLGQCYVDFVHIGHKCRHMVQVLCHSEGWLRSHEVSE